jgi:aspartate/methionine/tyrosine aminotransferase
MDDRGQFSLRTDHDASPSTLSRAVAERRAAGLPLLDLTEIDPTAAGIPHDETAIVEALADAAALGHRPEPRGLRSAREAVARDYRELGVTVDPERIVLTAGTSEAYSFLLTLLCDPHDEILVPAPGRPHVAQLAQLAGVTLSHYPLRWDGDRHTLDATAVYDAIDERTRAIVLAAPNDPTGTCVTDDAAEALDACGLPVISDELFARYPLDPTAHGVASLLAHPRETLSFALGGLATSAALPQMKLAWIAVGGPEDAAAAALERLDLVAGALLSVSAPVELALPALLASASRARDAIRARCRRNLEAVRAAARGTAITVPSIGGGWYAPLRVPATRTDEQWALALVEDGVLVRPGCFFDFPHAEAWLVVGLVAPEADFDAGIAAIRARCAR